MIHASLNLKGFNITFQEGLLSYKKVLVPVNFGMHWILAVLDTDARTIFIYDSFCPNTRSKTTRSAKSGKYSVQYQVFSLYAKGNKNNV